MALSPWRSATAGATLHDGCGYGKAVFLPSQIRQSKGAEYRGALAPGRVERRAVKAGRRPPAGEEALRARSVTLTQWWEKPAGLPWCVLSLLLGLFPFPSTRFVTLRYVSRRPSWPLRSDDGLIAWVLLAGRPDGLVFGRRQVVAGRVQAAVVPPVHPRPGGQFDLGDRPPRAGADQLGSRMITALRR